MFYERVPDKLYLHYDNAYRHKTYQGRDILQGAPANKFAWPLNEVVMGGHVTI